MANDWQPMETAPTDGTMIEGRIKWSDEPREHIEFKMVPQCDGWIGRYWENYWGAVTPTAWRPISEVPKDGDA